MTVMGATTCRVLYVEGRGEGEVGAIITFNVFALNSARRTRYTSGTETTLAERRTPGHHMVRERWAGRRRVRPIVASRFDSQIEREGFAVDLSRFRKPNDRLRESHSGRFEVTVRPPNVQNNANKPS
jgi:hypothetical protein